MDKKALFITFEGADGCGKTTQINLVKEYLDKKNIKNILTLEPGGCDIGHQLRQILLHHEGYVSNVAELFMYLADRSQHVETVIKKNIKENVTVLCDRYTDSTVAYQGYARLGNIEEIEYLNRVATKGFEPDLTFVLDVDSEVAQKRVGDVKDRLEKEGLEFHKKVRNGYLELAKKYSRIKVINANLTVEEVFGQIKEILDKYYE